MITRWALTAAVILSGFGCKAIGPLNEVPVRADWVQKLYPLETFAFNPIERGEAIWVRSKATPDHGMVVVPSKDRHVRGLDATTGRVIWNFQTKGPNVAQPTIIGEDLLVGSVDGYVYRIHQRNGRKIWASAFPGKTGVTSRIVTDGKQLYATSIGDRLAAFDLKTGALKWNRQRSASGEFTITGQAGALIDGNRIVTGFSDGRLMAFSSSDGATLWSADLSESKDNFVDVDTTPVKVGNLIVAASYANGLYGVSSKDGSVKWHLKAEGFRSCAKVGHILYVPTGDGKLFAVNGKTGKIIWKRKLSNSTPSTPAVSQKYLLLSVGESLLVVSRKDGKIISRVSDSHGFHAMPFYMGGVLFAQANSGLIYALGVY